MWLWLACAAEPNTSDTAPEATISWAADVQPMLSNYCGGCHGDSGCTTGLCWLDSYDTVVGETNGGCASSVAECIPIRIEDGTMPQGGGCPPGEPGCIEPFELDQVKRWIDAGMPR